MDTNKASGIFLMLVTTWLVQVDRLNIANGWLCVVILYAAIIIADAIRERRQ